MEFLKKFEKTRLRPGQISLAWLGQAGFLIKDAEGRCLAVDPYLSHCGERIKRFIRITPIIVDPEQLVLDACLITHKHFDHLDYDALPIIAANRSNDGTKFFGSSSASKEAAKFMGSKMQTLTEQPKTLWNGASCRAVFADHGELDPEAIGIWLEIEGLSIYITGDTAYRPDAMTAVEKSNPDIMIASINGRFGNLNAEEGAMLAAYTGAKAIIPCHFAMFVEHGGDPDKLKGAIQQYSPKTKPMLMTIGEAYICEKDGLSGLPFFERTQG